VGLAPASRGLRRSEQIIGASAIAFFIVLFFVHWLGGSTSTPLGGIAGGVSGWHSFTVSRWIWLITLLVALAYVSIAAGAVKLERPVRLVPVVAGLGALSTVLILYRIVHHPHLAVSGSLGGVHYSASFGIKVGIWLGLIAAASLTYGGYLAMHDEPTPPGAGDEHGVATVAAMSPSETPPGSAPPAPAQPVTPAPATEPQVPPPAAPAGPGEDPGPAAPPPSAEPEQPTGPPIPPPAAPAGQR
jgi:hypothetical protein